jgi:MtaA/CmuA family methyltransferase
MFDIFHIVRKRAGEKYSIHGEVTSPFDYFIDLFGVQESLLSLIDDPEKSKIILAHFAGLVRELAVAMCATGVDAIKISSPFAGSSFISPRFYREFVLPYEREIAMAIRATNVHAYTHTCGAIADRLELMFDSGVSGIECLDPPPLGNVELQEAKARTRGRGFIKGNVDSVNLLLDGTPEEILADAHKRITTGKQGGGFIFSTACSVAPYVRRDRLLLLREAVDRWG